MGKFSQAGKTGAGLSALDRLAIQQPDLPTGPQEETVAAPQQAPPPTAYPGTAQDPGVNLQEVEELPAPAQQPLEPQQQLEADLQEQQRQRVPNLRERWANVPTPAPIDSATASAKPDGGIIHRANRMAAAVSTGGLTPPVDLRGTTTEGTSFQAAQAGATGPQIAETIAAEKEGSIQAAINRVGAVDYTNPRAPQIDPDFIKAGSMVTENLSLIHI